MNSKASLLLRQRPAVLRSLHNHNRKRSLSHPNASQKNFLAFAIKPSSLCYSTSTQAWNRDVGLDLTGQATYPKEIEGPIGLPSRAEQLKRLSNASPESPYDVLVIGGGGVCYYLCFLCVHSSHQRRFLNFVSKPTMLDIE